MVLADTTVLSLAMRRTRTNPSSDEERLRVRLGQLIDDTELRILGMVRQELLSGIRAEPEFRRVKMALQAFPDVQLFAHDHERAAEFYTRCVAKGIQPSHIDMLICSVADGRGWSIFTVDKDFIHYSRVLPIELC